jgi:heme exporter protein B
MASGFVEQVAALMGKDFRREFRTGEIVSTTVAFALLLTLVFSFAFFAGGETIRVVFPGILWTAIVFTGTLVIARTFSQETEDGCLRALALVPGMDHSLYVAKLAVNLLFMFAFEVVLLPLSMVAFDIALASRLFPCATVIIGGTVGFSALGTLVSAMLVHNRIRDVLLPILLYPLAAPLVLAGVKATRILLEGGTWSSIANWLKILAGMDALFLVAGWTTFGWVLEAVE